MALPPKSICELFCTLRSKPKLIREFVIRAYDERKNNSGVARLFLTTIKTVRNVLRRLKNGGEEGLKDLFRRRKRFRRRTSAEVDNTIVPERKKTN